MQPFKTEIPMHNLSEQQKREAEQFFSKAVQYHKNKDYAGAAEWYKKAAPFGHPAAQNNLAVLYKNGLGVSEDKQEAFRLFLESARHGDLFGMRNLATCYLNGEGTTQDFETAVAWLTTAAERKDQDACAMLAGIYQGWQHQDEKKALYWHKKAADFGNAESMFHLASHYAKAGPNQNLDMAKDYYDAAAQAGEPELRLKVAKAFDVPNWGNEAALDLEKARKWYEEVILCDDEKLQLEAAKGLDEKERGPFAPKRPALNMTKAYMTYRALAMKGNKEACGLAAYCSEVGKGAPQNIDVAIMLYEKAGQKGKAEWCRKKKSGDLSDHVFEEHKNFQMPYVEPNIHSHRKELYLSNIESNKCQYDGRIYYLNYNSEASLRSSDLTGESVKIISREDVYAYGYLHVNVTGIYLYIIEDSKISVKHLDFDGGVISEHSEDYSDGCVDQVYFYDNRAYFVWEPESQKREYIQCMHIDEGFTETLYSKASRVLRVCANDDYLFFKANYENDDAYHSGWMIMNLHTGAVECLSNPYCSPENVVENPDVYNEDSIFYNDSWREDREIVLIDLDRELFWTERRSLEGEDSAQLRTIRYWEPRSLWGNRDEIVPNLPVWRLSEHSHSSREYFDGTYHYYAESYYEFKSSDKSGNVYKWSVNNGGHGVCDRFLVMGDYLYLNIAAYDEEQYLLSVEATPPLRKTWFEARD